MTHIRSFVAGLVAVAVVLTAAAACGDTQAVAEDPKPPSNLTSEVWYAGSQVEEARVHLSDGTTVLCVNVYKGGLSCDWANRRG